MSFRNLKIFMCVYEQGNISKAADLLYITQPAVSRAIKDLEQEYDCILFERMNRKLIPTSSAHTLYTKLIPIIEGYDSLHDVIQKDTQHTPIHIGTNSTIGKYILPSIITNYSTNHKDTTIYVIVENEITLQTKILQHELDFAIVENNTQHKDLHSLFLTQSPLSIIASSSYKIPSSCTIEQLSTYPLLLRESGSAQRNYVDAIFETHNLTVHPLWQSSTTDVLIEAATQGIGIAIVPTSCIQNRTDIKQISLTNEKLIRNCYLVYHKDKYLSKPLQQLIQEIQNKVR